MNNSEKVKQTFRVINIMGNNILMNDFKIICKYRSLSVYNQLLIAHIMSKVIFFKHLPTLGPHWS